MCTPYLRVVPPFYNHAAYLQCMRSIITDKIENHHRRVEHLLFSFHGLPEDQCSRTDTTGTVCMEGPDCCSQMSWPTGTATGRSASIPHGCWRNSSSSKTTRGP